MSIPRDHSSSSPLAPGLSQPLFAGGWQSPNQPTPAFPKGFPSFLTFQSCHQEKKAGKHIQLNRAAHVWPHFQLFSFYFCYFKVPNWSLHPLKKAPGSTWCFQEGLTALHDFPLFQLRAHIIRSKLFRKKLKQLLKLLAPTTGSDQVPLTKSVSNCPFIACPPLRFISLAHVKRPYLRAHWLHDFLISK